MKGPARDVQKNIRFSVADLDTLNKAAIAAGQSLAEFVRTAALERAAVQAQRDALIDMVERLMHDQGDGLERRLVDRIGSAADVAAADALAAVEKRGAAVYERIVARHQAAMDERLDRIDAALTGLKTGLGALAAPDSLTPPAASTAPAAPICPKCGTGHMVARVAASGTNAGKTFYACSAHPKCKHTSWKPDGS